jgi:hypothetical protein
MVSEYVGYVGSMSVARGGELTVHVATRAEREQCWADVYRVVGCADRQFAPRLEHVARTGPVRALRYAPDERCERLGPGDADVDGCGWPGQRILDAIPDEWPTGLYLVQFTDAEQPTGRQSERVGQDALVVVRPRADAPTSPVLVQLSVATWNAYHLWQNRSLYVGDVGDRTGAEAAHLRAHRVSFHRPGIGLTRPSNIPVFERKACMYVLPFVEWANEQGLELDYCSGLDIDRGRVELERYRLLVTLGHDEYWTRGQRDRVEAYVAEGGNAAFFGGNMAYWQIRLTDDETAIECYKRTADPHEPMGFGGMPLDPRYRDPELFPDHDNRDVTVEYHTPPLNRPPTTLTGVSMRNDDGAPEHERADPPMYCGACWWWENFGGPERPAKGFTVMRADHWAFAGTGLADGDEFGAEQKVIGFECDGLDVELVDGLPVPTLRDGAPSGIEILAYADCRDWAEADFSQVPTVRTPGRRLNQAALGGVVPLVTFRTEGGGRVFTAPATDWPHALVELVDYTDYRAASRRIAPACREVRAITANVLAELGGVEARSRAAAASDSAG